MNSFTINKQYIKFCAYGFLRNLRFFDAFFILFLREKGLCYTEIGILYAVREITINICEIPSGIVADTYGRKNSLMASFLLYIVSFTAFYLANEFWLFLTAFIFFGIGDAFRTGTHKGIIMNYLAQNNWSDQKINYYGHTRSWSQRGAAVSSLFAGLIVFHSGNYQNIFLYSIIPYILNFFLIMSYPGNLNHVVKADKTRKYAGMGQILKSFFKNLRQPNALRVVNMSAIHSAYLKAGQGLHPAFDGERRGNDTADAEYRPGKEKRRGYRHTVFHHLHYDLVRLKIRLKSGSKEQTEHFVYHFALRLRMRNNMRRILYIRLMDNLPDRLRRDLYSRKSQKADYDRIYSR